jgi:hypothetical protein
MCRSVSRFDFGIADVDGMILQLLAVDWAIGVTFSGRLCQRVRLEIL